MQHELWPSEQKARREHFCSYCGNWIQPGEIYARHVWVPCRGSFHVMNRHVQPTCPPNEGELHALRMIEAERAALGVPIVLTVQSQERILIERGGGTRVVHELTLVPTLLKPAEESEVPPDDEEIPF